MHNGHVMDKYESLWNTMPSQDGGVAKLDIFNAGNVTYGVTVAACNKAFEATLNGCNKKGASTQGGTNLALIGRVWYMININPPADQQNNGTYPSRGSKRLLLDPRNIGEKAIRPRTSIHCSDIGVTASYSDIAFNINRFCAQEYVPGSFIKQWYRSPNREIVMAVTWV
ncbi:hypothetical protein LTR56_024651 [Elasticomyces elasticus]|nr:hypothetical protein LTR56_024651 [Elasticomyces elasticus]KAK3622223.1 hypothetical protein LTR22_024883 [Elasticomyces elasticus]KAK4919773.1 hypothetical protein LTR49_012676 [Elasticomyces elasticus]KAK5758405.1 hypothetical protein LTS12_011427 [Elasticomyces elasticus]